MRMPELKYTSDKVEWWYKNGEGEIKYFSILYKDEYGFKRTFYVDFIVIFKDDSIGLFDTKSGFTTKEAGPRAEGLQKYIKGLNIQYPLESGQWYKGSHEPLITKEIFDRVSAKRIGPGNVVYGAKEFAYRGLFKCGKCGSNIIAEDKFKKLLDGNFNHHIYYHCSKTLDINCGKHYLKQEELESKIIEFIEGLDMENIKISSHLKYMFEEYKKIAGQALAQQNINVNEGIIDLKNYARYVFKEGNVREKPEFVKGLNITLYIHNKEIYMEAVKEKWSLISNIITKNIKANLFNSATNFIYFKFF
jgi:hypothetical protein